MPTPSSVYNTHKYLQLHVCMCTVMSYSSYSSKECVTLR